MFLQKILHNKFVGLRLLAILFIAAGLALTGCDESGGGGGGFSDKRSDADLVDVMAAALAEALAAGETGYNTLTTVNEVSGLATGGAVESQAGSAAATGLAGAALTAGLQMDGLSGTSAESSEMIRHRVEMEVLRALAAAPM
ncbi:MAG: hypothetical protein O7D96_07720, partial [SAR324 cluster bacterium]|nr:hypothetical protein [SAR324 cluster bacterium]